MRIKRLGLIGAKGAAAHCAGSELTTASGGAVAGLRRRRRPGLGSARGWVEEQARDAANSLAGPARDAEATEG